MHGRRFTRNYLNTLSRFAPQHSKILLGDQTQDFSGLKQPHLPCTAAQNPAWRPDTRLLGTETPTSRDRHGNGDTPPLAGAVFGAKDMTAKE